MTHRLKEGDVVDLGKGYIDRVLRGGWYKVAVPGPQGGPPGDRIISMHRSNLTRVDAPWVPTVGGRATWKHLDAAEVLFVGAYKAVVRFENMIEDWVSLSDLSPPRDEVQP